MFKNFLFYFLNSKFDESKISFYKTEIVQKYNGTVLENLSKTDDNVFILTNLTSEKRVMRSLGKLNFSNLKVVNVTWLDKCFESGTVQDYSDYLVAKLHSRSQESLKEQLKSVESVFSNTKYECQRKAPLDCLNDSLVQQLSFISRARFLSNEPRSSLSYQKASASIRSCPVKLTKDNFAHLVPFIPNIGPKIQDLLREVVVGESEFMSEFLSLKSDERLSCLEMFCFIYGVGPSSAAKWYNDLGWRTLDDIHVDSLTKQQRAWLKYMKYNEKLSRLEIELIVAHLENLVLNLVDKSCIFTIVGSYRRGKLESGDIDVIISHPVESINLGTNGPLLNRIIDVLKKSSFLKEVLFLSLNSKGIPETLDPDQRGHVDQLSAICLYPPIDKHFQLDLVVPPKSAYATCVLGWTGSTMYERSLRLYCKREKNIHVTSYGIYDTRTGRRFDTRTEKDIYTSIGLDFMAPIDRNC